MILSILSMLTIAGLALQMKITYDAYKIARKLKNRVEAKFQALFNEYLQLKKDTLKSVESANETVRENKKLAFMNHFENADFEYKMLCDKLRYIETSITFTPEEMPVYPKILSILSLFGNVMLFIYKWMNQNESTIALWRRFLSFSIFSAAGLLGLSAVFYAYDTRAIERKTQIIKYEAKEIERSIKNEIDLLKRNKLYFPS